MDSQQRIFAEIASERARQDEKWGVQNHPLVLEDSFYDAEYWANRADQWKRLNDNRVEYATMRGVPKDRNCAWDGILEEEVAEAFGAEAPGLQYAEFVQTAAVAVAILLKLDRDARKATGHAGLCPALDHQWILTAPEACDCGKGGRFQAVQVSWGQQGFWGVRDNERDVWMPVPFGSSEAEAREYAEKMGRKAQP